MIKILVPSEEDRQDLIEQSRYCAEFKENFKIKGVDGQIKNKTIRLNDNKAGILKRLHIFDDIIEVDNELFAIKIIVSSNEIKQDIIKQSKLDTWS